MSSDSKDAGPGGAVTADRMVIQSVPGEGAFEPFNKVGGPLQEGVMPLIAMVNGEVFPVGTAFAVHPYGLLMTAAHVLEYAAALPKKHGVSGYGLYALYMREKEGGGPELFGGPLPVDRIWADTAHDVALVWAPVPYNDETKEHLRLRVSRLRPRPLAEGEHLIAVGYHGMNERIPIVDGVVEYAQQTAIATGRVLDSYPYGHGRDRVLAPFPCFHTDARFEPAMSGGPIAGEDGGVAAVVCRGLSEADHSQGYLSLGASIWPAFGIPIEMPDGINGWKATTLYELAKAGLVDVDSSLAGLTVEGRSVTFNPLFRASR
jgi:hypothetical protein